MGAIVTYKLVSQYLLGETEEKLKARDSCSYRIPPDAYHFILLSVCWLLQLLYSCVLKFTRPYHITPHRREGKDRLSYVG